MSAKEINRQLEIADLTYQGENYKEAYDKFSAILENDFENKQAWIGKGLSAGMLSNKEKTILSEAKICFEKANEQGLTEDEKNKIINGIFEITEQYFDSIHESVKKQLADLDSRPMATGEKPSVRLIGTIADRLDAFSDHYKYYEKGIEFSNFAITLDDSVEVKKKVLDMIDSVLNESKQHFDKNAKPKIMEWRKSIIDQIKKSEPDFQPKELETKMDQCFIATATYGSLNSPVVVELRNFRDKTLVNKKYGQKFIDLYYRYSPRLSLIVNRRKTLQYFSRFLIETTIIKIVRFINKK